MLRLVDYSGHEWRAAMDGARASTTRVVCAECGIEATIGEWPEQRCRSRLAPIDWLPLDEQTDDRVVVAVDSAGQQRRANRWPFRWQPNSPSNLKP